MKFVCTLIAVKDMDKAKQFYHDVLGLEVIADFGANVTLTGGIGLQTVDTWQAFINKTSKDITFGNNAGELYFEDDDIDSFYSRLQNLDYIEYVHPLIEHTWGQRAVRFYDTDKHIIEVGENIAIVVRRFIDSGLSVEETAARMGVPVEYLSYCLT